MPTLLLDSNKNAQITWQSSELSPTYLEHGPTQSYGTVISNTSNTVNHQATVNSVGLNDSYFINVKSIDLAGNTNNKEFVFPLIKNIAISYTSNTATVQWYTYAPTDSQIEWGTSLNFGQQTTPDTNLVTNHSVLITGLNPLSTYYFRIKSRTVDGIYYVTDVVGSTKSTYIREWLMNGLYSTTNLTQDFLNEQNVTPNERKLDGNYTWAKIISNNDVIDLNSLYQGPGGENDNKVIYAHTYVYSNTTQDVFLSMGSDDGIMAWVNGNLVWTNDVTRGHVFDQDKVLVTLNQGWNRVLIKVKNGSGGYAFSARFVDAAANPIDLKNQLNDPTLNNEVPDTTAPSIFDVKTTVLADNKVRVEWYTDEESQTYLEWGKTTQFGSSVTDNNLRLKHWYDLGPFEALTTYNFRIKSTDRSGNTVFSEVYQVASASGSAPYIHTWLINGPYVNSDPNTRLIQDYLGGETVARPSEGEGTLAAGKLWEPLTSGDYVDLSAYGTDQGNVMYAHTYFEAYGTTNTYLWLGNTGGISAWVNGVNVFTKEQVSEYVYDRIPITLTSGLNKLLIKVSTPAQGQPGFSARVANAYGSIVNFKTYYNYLLLTANPATTFNVRGEWMTAFESGVTKAVQAPDVNGIFIRNSYNNGAGWYPSLAVVSDASEPALTWLGAKTALFYKKSDGTNQQLRLMTTTDDGTTWSNEIALTNSAASVYHLEALTIDNTAYVFYSYNDGSLYYRTSQDMVNWSAEALVGQKIGINQNNTKPYFAVTKLWNGKWALSWLDVSHRTDQLPGVANSTGYPVITYATSGDLQSWTASQELNEPYTERWPGEMSLAEDMGGNLVLAFDLYQYPWDKYTYYKYSADEGNSWTGKSVISVPSSGIADGWQNGYTAVNPYLTYDINGNVVAFYNFQPVPDYIRSRITYSHIPRGYNGPVGPENAFGLDNHSGEEGFGVNPAIGNYSYQNEDLQIAGKGLPLNITRSFNSGSAKNDGPFGYGWTHNYNISLSVGVNGIVNVSTEDGRVDTFVLGLDNTYTPFPGVFDKLIKNGDGTWTLKRTNRTALYFNTAGTLTKITDKNGNNLTFTYDTNKRLTKVTDAGGRFLTITYDTGGHITTVTDPANRQHKYNYTDGNLTAYTDPAAGVITYAYDTGHRITQVTNARGNMAIKVAYDSDGKVSSQQDAKGNTTSFAYDPTGRRTTVTEGQKTTVQDFDGYYRLIKETDALGYTTTFTYDGLGNRASVTDANGHKTTYGYDLNGNLTKTVDPLGGVTANRYNTSSDLVARTDPKGNTTTFEYDTKGNLLKSNLANGKFTAYTYYPDGLPQTFTDANGNTSTYAYNGNGYLASETNALGQSATYTYDSVGHRLTKTDALGKTTTYTYDVLNNLLTLTDPLNHTTAYEYDANGNKTKETNALNKTTTYGYDELDQLVTVTDAVYNVTAFEYDGDSSPVKITDALGNITANTYDAAGRLLSTTDANGHTTTYTYDGNDNKLTVTDALANTTRYAYDALNRPVSVTDPLGRTTTYAYDANGNLTKETDALGNITLFAYDALNNLITVTDAAYRVTRYEYDGSNNRIKTIDAKGQAALFEYDKANRLIKETNPLNQVTVREFDANGRLVRTVLPGNVITANDYDDAGKLIAFTDGRGNTTRYGYNALNKVVTVTDAVYNTKATTYDDLGRISSETDWRGNTTSFEYDQLGRRTKITYPDLSTETFTYDAVGNKLTVTDGEGRTTAYAYDALNRVATVTDAVYGTTTYTYDAAGNLTGETDALGRTVTNKYDGLNRLIEKVLPGNISARQTYDQVGNLKQVTDPNGNVTSYDYDELNRPVKVTDALGNVTRSEYDALGNRVKLIDAKGKITTYGYNERNLMVSVTDPLTHTTLYDYDANGNLTKVTDARSNSTLYEFDPLNRTIKVTDPLNRSKTITYDANGNKDSETDAKGQTVQYGYDNMNQLTTVTAPGNKTVNYTYDRAGNRLQMTDTTGAANYTYDALNRPVKISYTRNGLDLNYSYDAVGNRTLLTVTRGTTVLYSVYYQYNERDQLNQLTDRNGKTFTFNYDNAGNVTEVSYPNGTKAQFTYDGKNQVTAINNLQATGGNIRNYSYTYDPNGRRTQMVTDGTDITDYAYDDLGQLIGVTDKRGSFTFTYDEVGNRLQMVVNSVYATDYTYDSANQLLTAGANTYTYDANGNRASKTTVNGTVYYEYDYRNLLTGITRPDGSVTYSYDGDSKRISRASTLTGASYYIFDGDTAIMEGATPDLANPTAYLAGINGLLAKISPEGIMAYYYYDAQGNLGAVTDEAGNISDTLSYDAWGAISERTGTSDEKYAYVGKYGVTMEPDDDLLMMGLRFYDPELGIFLQKDPFPGYIEDPTLLHPYMYTRNDPVNRIDPTGESFLGDIVEGGKALYNDYVKPAARWVNENVIQPVADAVDTYVIQPGKKYIVDPAIQGFNRYVVEPYRKARRGIANGTAKRRRRSTKRVNRKTPPVRSNPAYRMSTINCHSSAARNTFGPEFSSIPTGIQRLEPIAGFALEFNPAYAIIKSVAISLTGTDPYTGEKVNNLERGLAIGSLLPVGRIAGGLKGTAKLIKGSDEVVDAIKGTGEAEEILGGAYKNVPKNGGQNHHMPADSVSPYSTNEGPALKMETADHMQTKSWGNSRDARAYRAQQKELIEQGRFKEAQQMDIDDITSQFGNKYDRGIQQVKDYTKNLLSKIR